MSVLNFAYDVLYQRSPILLMNGRFFDYFPIGGLFGLYTQGEWAFKVQDGTELYRTGINEYPFANGDTAVNGMVKESRTIQYQLEAPANSPLLQMAVCLGIIKTLETHRDMGGVFTCITPSAFEENCILLSITQTSSSVETSQLQPAFQFTFIKPPIVALSDAEAAYNSLMKKVSNAFPSGALPL